MAIFIKFLILTLSSAIGFFSWALFSFFAYKAGLFPDIALLDSANAFKLSYFGGAMWVWIFATLTGLGYLFSETSRRFWFLLAPVYVPALYIVGSLTYFSN